MIHGMNTKVDQMHTRIQVSVPESLFYCKQRLIYIYVTILRYSNIFKIPIDETDPTGIAHEVLGEMSARLMPGSVVRNNPEDVRSLIFTLVGHMGPICYYLGGAINNVSPDETAVNPHLRSAIWSMFTIDGVGGKTVREFVKMMRRECVTIITMD